MTSRFREELAARPADPPASGSPTPSRRRSRRPGRAVFFSGLTVLLGLIGLVLFEFMILRSVGIAGRDRRLPRGVVGADAAAGAPRDRRAADRRPRDPAGRAARRPERTLGAARPVGHAPPGRGPRADARRVLLVLGSPFLHVRFNAPDSTILPAERPVAGRVRPARRRVRRGRVRADRARDPDRPARRRRRRTSPRSTTTRGGSRPIRGSAGSIRSSTSTRASGWTSTSSSTPTRTGRATGSSRRRWPRRPRATSRRSRSRRRSARTATRAGRSSADLREPAGPLAPPAGMTVLVGGGAADVADVVGRVAAGLPADGAVHRRDDLPRPVPAPPLGRPAGQGARDEHAVDRRAASARSSGSSRTATCRRCSGSSRSGSSRRPSR